MWSTSNHAWRAPCKATIIQSLFNIQIKIDLLLHHLPGLA